MTSILEDIKKQSDWIVQAFKEDGLILDFTIRSFIQIDKFFELHSDNGEPKPGGRLSKNLGIIIFSIGCYIGETFIRNIPDAVWIADENDPESLVNAAI